MPVPLQLPRTGADAGAARTGLSQAMPTEVIHAGQLAVFPAGCQLIELRTRISGDFYAELSGKGTDGKFFLTASTAPDPLGAARAALAVAALAGRVMPQPEGAAA